MDEDPSPEVEVGSPNKRRRTASDHRELFLLEMLRHDGRGDDISSTFCNTCGITVGSYRCKDCFMSRLSCQMCVVAAHAYSPVHRVEKWNGECFKNITLKNLGLHVQLGHKAYTLWLWTFVGAIERNLTLNNSYVSQFHVLSFESKVLAYEFYHSLVHMTDNTGLLKHRDRYEAFMCMAREFRHVKMLKRAGRSHDPSGIIATQQGECVVLCPACPQPGKNLPDDWELAPKGKGSDRQIVSKDTVDPSLSRGWGNFVNETEYKAHLTNQGMEAQEKSMCTSHNAVNMADSKSSKGLAATGLGTIDCARHNMNLPNGVGDLQKGERYINMDFLFFSTLRHHSLDVLNVSYDIACQWHKNLWARMATLPKEYQLNHAITTVQFFVLKFHLPAHIAKLASSTKEMGPGCRRDTLDDHFGDWNWKKVVNLEAMLLCKTKETMLEKAAFHATFEELDAAITEEHRIAWKAEVERWEENPNDMSVSNLFEAKSVAITQAGARLKLAQLEAKELE
ncbi:hypothetical protein CY34DRAFT_14196 [Suillus luteus UH-Slu-Lm8-n1]|uniref:CxC2-like cysteine cluster KDZ transposase-associated domain-containing protein n=1 Tax=Suillus luteus UH-Slu-Lm8-n1 TaxID=930992 RepID=A0A0D0B7B8_9AGAM|nr:hypothetical protein CY34DRAFT_14196 [Suillus luteus UH-Slu-Lm8-n1]